MAETIILPELRDLLPRLAKEEKGALKNSLKTEGQREAIIRWQRPDNTYVLVEGHNRLELLKELGIKPEFEDREWASIEDVKEWMFTNALGRRNLPKEWMQYIIGKEYLEAKKKPGGPSVGQIDPVTGKAERTSAAIGRKHKVSEATVRRAANLAKKVDQRANGSSVKKAEILNGKKAKKKPSGAFDSRKFLASYGYLSRQLEVYASKNSMTGTTLHKNCNKALSIFWNQWESLVAKVAKGK